MGGGGGSGGDSAGASGGAAAAAAADEDNGDDLDISRAWESIRENKKLQPHNLIYSGLKYHEPWFNDKF
jgi:hypothetical protein